jgi:hypothetical protein
MFLRRPYDPGNEVIVFELFYGDHLSTLQSLEIVARLVSLQRQERELHLS